MKYKVWSLTAFLTYLSSFYSLLQGRQQRLLPVCLRVYTKCFPKIRLFWLGGKKCFLVLSFMRRSSLTWVVKLNKCNSESVMSRKVLFPNTFSKKEIILIGRVSIETKRQSTSICPSNYRLALELNADFSQTQEIRKACIMKLS